MEKSITILREEFVQELVSLISDCRLPAFAVADVLRSFTDEASRLAHEQYKKDMAAYEVAQKEEEDG